ncbi:MAG: HAD hydrolase family protein, partial [Muribaculaceae bacterium]|nr:HAD hydrolase family protein [Muribaculaceae bacterium]
TTGRADSIYEAASRLNTPEFPCSVSAYPDIFDPTTALIEVFAPEVSKAAAVKRLQESVGADRLVVFGDNLNDLSMMKVADVAVAVENAQPEVKQHADVVIAANDFDSVARYISADFGA